MGIKALTNLVTTLGLGGLGTKGSVKLGVLNGGAFGKGKIQNTGRIGEARGRKAF